MLRQKNCGRLLLLLLHSRSLCWQFGMFHAYEGQQRELRWVSVSLTTIATLLLLFRLSATIKNRGWLGLEDTLVIAANVSKDPDRLEQFLISQLFLIIFTVMIHEETQHGFGLRVADIKRTGGDLITAMKVRRISQAGYSATDELSTSG